MVKSQLSEIELKFAAFSSAMTDMLASLSYENAVLRHLLVTHGHLVEHEFENALQSFGQEAWETRKNQVHNKVQELLREALSRMSGDNGLIQ